MTEIFPQKIDIAKSLLKKGDLFIHLDPRSTGVIVPPWLKDQFQLVLQIGYDMAIPIPDLVIDSEGIAATLSFNRKFFGCIIPWSSIFALVGDQGKGQVWSQDIPLEIEDEIKKEETKQKTQTSKKTKQFKAPAKPKKELPPYLRVIK